MTITTNALPVINAGTDQTLCDGDLATLSGSGGVSYAWDNSVSDNIPFSSPVGTTTTYSVIGTDANGCENSDQVDVSVNILPSINAGTDFTACDGDQITLSATTSETPSWDNGVVNGVPFSISTGVQTFTVNVTGANGCQNSDQVDVTVNALPAIDAGVNQILCDGDLVTLFGSGGLSYLWNNGILDSTAFTPSIGTTTYEVTGIDVNGCENIDQVDITVNGLPNINGGADTTICHGDSLLLNASGNGSIDWTGGLSNNTYFVPTNPQTELVCTATGTSGCQNTDTILVNMATAINTSLTVSAADIVAASGYVNYEWQYCESSVTIQNGLQNTFTATQDGNYKVIIRNSQNCFDTSECILIDYLDLSTLDSDELVELAPNPTSGKVYIPNEAQLESVVVYDASGRIVLSLKGHLTEIDFTGLESGTYVVRMITADKRYFISRVVKQN